MENGKETLFDYRTRAERCAKELGKVLNPNEQHVICILMGLQHNTEKYGEAYCPCKLQHVDKNVCPCQEVRNTGNCYCMLYLPPAQTDTK